MRLFKHFISNHKFTFMLFFLFGFLNLTYAQDYTSYYAIVNDLETNLPIDSAHVTLLKENIPIDSAYTDTDGVAVLKAPVTNVNSNYTQLPTSFQVHQNYPNPSFQRTNIPFTIARNGEVSYKLYNILGQEVMSGKERLQPGHYRLLLDGLNNVAKGVYILNIATHGNSQSIKMVNLGSGGQPFALATKIILSNNLELNDQSNMLKTTQPNLDNLSLHVSKELYYQQEQTIISDTTYFALERSHYIISGFSYGVTDSGKFVIPNALVYTAISKDSTYSNIFGEYKLLFFGLASRDTLFVVSEGFNPRCIALNATDNITLDVEMLYDQLNIGLFEAAALRWGSSSFRKPDSAFENKLSYYLENPPDSIHLNVFTKAINEIGKNSSYTYEGYIEIDSSKAYCIIKWVENLGPGGMAATNWRYCQSDDNQIEKQYIYVLKYLTYRPSILAASVKEVNNLFSIGDLIDEDIPEDWKESMYYIGPGNPFQLEVPEIDKALLRIGKFIPYGYEANANHVREPN